MVASTYLDIVIANQTDQMLQGGLLAQWGKVFLPQGSERGLIKELSTDRRGLVGMQPVVL